MNFFTNGLMLTLVPRLPEIKQAFELSDDFYGIVVAAMGAALWWSARCLHASSPVTAR